MGKAQIGALNVELGLDTAQFEDGLQSARAGFSKFRDNIIKVDFNKGLKRGLREVEGGMKGAAGQAGLTGAALSSMGIAGFGAAAALGGLVIAMGKAREAVAFADAIGDTAAKLAVSTDALQEYRYAVHALGGEYKDADAALEGFQKAFGNAQSGYKKALKPFEQLGLDPATFRSTEEALRAVTAKIAQLGSTAQQASIAEKLGLSPMLTAIRAGVGEMDRLRIAAHNAGYVMDAQLVAKAGGLNDQMEDLNQVVDVQLKSAFIDLAPVLLDVLGLAASIAREIGEMVDNLRSVEDRRDSSLKAKRQKLVDQNLKNPGGLLSNDPVLRGIRAVNDAEIRRIDVELAKRAKAAAAIPRGGAGLAGSTGGGSTGRKGLSAAEKAAAAESKIRTDALNDEIDALVRASQASLDYIDDLKIEQQETGATAAQLIMMRAQRKAAEAPTEALATAILATAAASAAAADAADALEKKWASVKPPKPFPDISVENVKSFEEHIETSAEKFKRQFNEAFEDVGSSFNGLFSSLKNKDWAQASKGLLNAIGAIKKAWAEGGTGGKIGAAAGVADAAGQAIGGTFGAGLSGAAGGAMLGLQLGGPIGAAAGAVIGGLLGVFGASSAKKKAAKEAAAQAAKDAAEAAAAKALEIANQKRAIELRILELSGDSLALQAAMRSDELAAMDESNREQAMLAYYLEDQAEARAKAEALLLEQRALEVQLLEAQGRASEALALSRQLELDATEPALQGLKKLVWAAQDLRDHVDLVTKATQEMVARADEAVASARSDLSEAYQVEADRLKTLKSRFEDFASSLSDFQRELMSAGGGTSAQGRYQTASAEFRRVSALAAIGNEAALGSLRGVSEDFLEASKATARSMPDFLKDLGAVRAAVQRAQEAAARQVSLQQQELDKLDAQVEGLGVINTSVLSVTAAVQALAVAMASRATAGATAGSFVAQAQAGRSFGAASANIPVNLDLAAATGFAGSFGAGGFQSWIVGQSEAVRDAARQVLTAAGQDNRIVGFATGGSFEVGGSGGIDSQVRQLRLTPGERVSIDRHGDARGQAQAMEALGARVDRLTELLEHLVLNSNKVTRTVTDRAGVAVRGPIPGEPLAVAS